MSDVTSFYPLLDALVLSHTANSSATRCLRKMEFRQFYGRPGFRLDNFAGDVGNALHRGLASWLVDRNEDKALWQYAMHYPFELEYLDPSYSARSFEAGYSTMQALMASELLADYEVAKIKIDNGQVIPAVEVPFAIEIVGSPFPLPVFLVGFIDVILHHIHKKTFGVTDLKTTRMWSTDPSSKYRYDEQTVPYGVMLEHLLQQHIVEFDVAYLHTYIDLLEPTVSMQRFTKSQQDLQDWFRGLCQLISRLANGYKTGWFPRATNGDTCVAFNKPCEFFDICAHRDHKTIARMIQGEKRDGLFRNGEQPWVTAKMSYVGG